MMAGVNDELARAVFDALVPYRSEAEAWELATKVGEKIKQAMFDAARDHKHAEFEDFDKPTLLQVIRQLQDRVLFFERELQACNTSDRLKGQEINSLRRKLEGR
jgi:hypothetical protein